MDTAIPPPQLRCCVSSTAGERHENQQFAARGSSLNLEESVKNPHTQQHCQYQ